jgi:hypothetical protein
MILGKKGIGLGKRTVSPGATKRAAKVSRKDEETERESYRDRTRNAFEQRRAAGGLVNATQTMLSLDEKAGVKVSILSVRSLHPSHMYQSELTTESLPLQQFNILSLDPQDPASVPPELLTALADIEDSSSLDHGHYPNLGSSDEKERLRKQMQLDALQPLNVGQPGGTSDDDDDISGNDIATDNDKTKKNERLPLSLSEDEVADAETFLQLSVSIYESVVIVSHALINYPPPVNVPIFLVFKPTYYVARTQLPTGLRLATGYRASLTTFAPSTTIAFGVGRSMTARRISIATVREWKRRCTTESPCCLISRPCSGNQE